MTKTMKGNQKTLSVGGKLVVAVTVTGLARIVGKSRDTILRYERDGVFPQAPFRLKGYRYYPLSLAKSLVPLVDRIPQHKKPDSDLIVEITKLFNEERRKYA